MATKKAKKSAHRTLDNYAYLTKRLIVRKAAKAGKEASEGAMDVMGYVVKVDNGWVIRQNKDGSVQKISRIEA